MVDHPLLPTPRFLPSRRVPPGFGHTPDRNPRAHGRGLREQFDRLPAPSGAVEDGVDPRFVFKIESSSGFSEEEILERRGLEILGHDDNATYFVLAGDGGVQFAAALDEYAAGANVQGASGPLKTLYNNIDSISLYDAADRSGPGIEDLDLSGDVVVDVTLWPAPDMEEADSRMRLLELVLQESDGSIVARSVLPRFTIARCKLAGVALQAVLGLYVVEKIRTPPVPFIDPSDWRDVETADLDIEWTPSAAVGVLDDQPAVEHPLLAAHVEIEAPIAVLGRPWVQPGHHGSMVSGLVLNPRYDRDLRSGSTIHQRGDVVAIRVLEPLPGGGADETRFPPEALTPKLIVDSIRRLHNSRGIRVFNLSFGFDRDYSPSHVGELSEMIDDLIRELDIVVVVAAGNATTDLTGRVPSGHHVAADYPVYFESPAHGIAQPANAALALTVGSIAVSDAPAERFPPRLGERAVALIGHLSPFSRTGPGHGTTAGRLNKPEFVAPGGNVVVDDTGVPSIRDQGTGIVSTALPTSGSLFYVGHGTSFAAPAISNAAAAVVHAYPTASGNLVRALLATSSNLPVGAQVLGDERVRHARYGFGTISLSEATESVAQRVTMTFDGDLAVDTAVIHPIPLPRDFALPRSTSRRIRVAIAFDPPVRRTRREYTASTMTTDFYRNVSLEQLQELMAEQDPNNRQPLLRGRQRVAGKMRPPATSMQESTVQVRDWWPTRLNVDDGDVYYLVVTHKTRTWFRDRDDYQRQRYAIAVTLADESLIDLDLLQEVTQRVAIPARVRV